MSTPNGEWLIRQPRIEDLNALEALEVKCWAPALRASRAVLEERVVNNTDNVFVLASATDDKNVHGVLYTQRISAVDELSSTGGAAKIVSLRVAGGPILELIAINVDTETAPTGGNMLRNAALEFAQKDETVQQVVAMTRCSAFNTEGKDWSAYESYVNSVSDPTIFFHVSGGAQIKKIVADYRPEDAANLGGGVLIEYPIRSTDVKKSDFVGKPAMVVSADAVFARMSVIRGVDLTGKATIDTPILDVLDSQQLMELHSWLEKQTKVTLVPDFLFRHSTAARVQNHLETLDQPTQSNVNDTTLRSVDADEPIAIVGVGMRLPGEVTSLEGLWDMLSQKKVMSRKADLKRWGISESDLEALLPDAGRTKAASQGCFLDDIESFDSTFFELSEQETAEMDPNQRLALELVARALFDAKQGDWKTHTGKDTGVWVGISNPDYSDVPGGGGFRESRSVYSATGSAISMIAGRIAFLLGTVGPTMAIDTACSSSLVALHQACLALQRGETSEAIVVGVNLMLAPWISVAYSRAGMLSIDGRCHTFDGNANGYCRGEGGGAIILKRLSDVDPSADKVYGVIRSSSVLHHGRGASLTAPNSEVQAKLLRRTLAAASLNPQDISFIEAHGTGTKLGDPIEVAAIAEVYGESNGIYVSGIKANVGHLEAAAGMASLFSALCTLQYGQLPPNAGLNSMNPLIASSVKDKNIYFPTQPTPLVTNNSVPLRGAVSSFGYSGTIANVLLEASPFAHKNDPLTKHLPELSGVLNVDGTQLVFQFTGQGNLRLGACASFLENDAFCAALCEVDPLVHELIGHTLSAIIYCGVNDNTVAMTNAGLKAPFTDASGKRWTEKDATVLLDEPMYSQVFLVALEYCLAMAWKSLGYTPDMVLGHSLGEYTACVLVGVWSLRDGLKVVHARARVVTSCDECRGKMVVLPLPTETIAEAISRLNLNTEVSIAVVNGPSSVVISGKESAVDSVLKEFEGTQRWVLKMKYAFHSPLLEAVVSEFRSVIESVPKHLPSVKFCSTVEGYVGVLSGEELLTTEYWVRHMRNGVHYFAGVTAAVDALKSSGNKVILAEMGPADTLSMLSRSLASEQVKHLASSNVKYGESSSQSLPSLSEFELAYHPKPVPYSTGVSTTSFANQGSEGIVFQTTVDLLKRYGANVLADHAISSRPVIAGASFLELLAWVQTALDTQSQEILRVKDFTVTQPFVMSGEDLTVKGNKTALTKVIVRTDGQVSLTRFDIQQDDFQRQPFATALIEFTESASITLPTMFSRSVCTISVDSVTMYSGYAERGLVFGENFRMAKKVIVDPEWKKLSAELHFSLPNTISGNANSALVPAQLVDAMIHTAGVLLYPTSGERATRVSPTALFIPFFVESFDVNRSMLTHARGEGQVGHLRVIGREVTETSGVFDCFLFDHTGEHVLLNIRGLTLRAIAASSINAVSTTATQLKAVHVATPGYKTVYRQLVAGPTSLREVKNLTIATRRVKSAIAENLRDELSSLYGAKMVTIIDLKNTPSVTPEFEQGDVLVYLVGSDGLNGEAGLEGGLMLEEVLTDLRTLGTWKPPLVHVVTSLHNVNPRERLLQTSVKAATLAARLEYFDTHFAVADVHCSSLSQAITQLLLEAEDAVEFDVTDTSTLRKSFVPVVSVPTISSNTDMKYSLRLIERGSLDNLVLTTRHSFFAAKQCEPGAGDGEGLLPSGESVAMLLKPDEIIVDVSAISLNFRDVLNVLGMYPGNPGDPGCEFAGVVRARGKDITHLEIGQRVVGFGEGCLQQELLVDGNCVVPLPNNVSMADGATIPIVFCTVFWALHDIAALKSDEVILIHSGAGGIGLAAIQYAKRLGARILTTTSSAEKRAVLEDLGVDAIFSSRNSKEFREGLQSWQDKTGLKVNVVLNALSDDFIPFSVEAMAPSGRFVELGKRGIWEPAQMTAVRPDIGYHVLALDNMAQTAPMEYNVLLTRVCEAFSRGDLAPIAVKIFDYYNDYKEAFGLLKTGKNIGKVVLRVDLAADQSEDTQTVKCNPRVAVLTGGTGSLGVLIAHELVTLGAKYIFLASSSGKLRHDVADTLGKELFSLAATAGVHLEIVPCDVSDERAVESLLTHARRVSQSKIDTVIHCAGVVRDALLNTGALVGAAEVWRAKALSAWWLHKHTADDNVSRFVCLSSIVSSIGREGQSAYAASNRFLDELIRHRLMCNLSSVSVQLPAVADIGMAAHGIELDHWSVHSSVIAKVFAAILNGGLCPLKLWNSSRDNAFKGVLTIFPHTLGAMLDAPLMCEFADALQYAKSASDNSVTTTELDAAASVSVNVSLMSQVEVEQLVLDHIQRFLASHITNFSVDDNLLDGGVDSLSATELSSSLSKVVSLRLPPTLVFNYSTVRDIARRLKQMAPSPVEKSLSLSALNTSAPDTPRSASNLTQPLQIPIYSTYVAAIGIAMRFPGHVNSLDSLHNAMQNKAQFTREADKSRYDTDAILSSSDVLKKRQASLQSMKYGGFLAEEDFTFRRGADFGVTEMEWQKMDVRQRLSMSVAMEALRDAGFSRTALIGKKIGVFCAALGQLKTGSKPWDPPVSAAEKPSVFDATSNSLSVISGRLSFCCGFTGPSISIDTACSSSLVAIHQAKSALQNRECDAALVVAVNFLDPELSVSFALGGLLSPDGRCHTFDESANGYCRGEGAAAMLLTRVGEEDIFSDARDIEGHSGIPNVYGVIKGSSILQDGKSASLTAPNGQAQEELIRCALSEAGIKANDVSLIEAHGTGTKLGDPIEVEALASVYGGSSRKQPLYINSVKANLGHLEACAGLAGLFSAFATFKYRTIHPNGALSALNPAISKTIEGLPFYFPTESLPLTMTGPSREVNLGLSSFGYSGTIGHVIVANNTSITAPISVRSGIVRPVFFSDTSSSHGGDLDTPIVPLPTAAPGTLQTAIPDAPSSTAIPPMPPSPSAGGRMFESFSTRIESPLPELLSLKSSSSMLRRKQFDWMNNHYMLEWESSHLQTSPYSSADLLILSAWLCKHNLALKNLDLAPLTVSPESSIFTTISDTEASVVTSENGNKNVVSTTSCALVPMPTLLSPSDDAGKIITDLTDFNELTSTHGHNYSLGGVCSWSGVAGSSTTDDSTHRLFSLDVRVEDSNRLSNSPFTSLVTIATDWAIQSQQISGHFSSVQSVGPVIVSMNTIFGDQLTVRIYYERPSVVGSDSTGPSDGGVLVVRRLQLIGIDGLLRIDISNLHLRFLSENEMQSSQRASAHYHATIARVMEVLDSVIMLDDVADDVDISSMGLDSLITTELANRLSDEFHVNINTTRIADNPTKRGVVSLVLEQLGVFQDLVAMSALAPSGDTYRGNPVFANYFPADDSIEIDANAAGSDANTGVPLPPGTSKTVARLVIFGGMAHPAVSWHKFVKPIVSAGISVHIARLSGRFERLGETDFSTDCRVNVKEVCESLVSLGMLENDMPVAFLGYSFGSVMAYECCRYMEHVLHRPACHFFPLAGPDRAVYNTWTFPQFNDPAQRTIDNFVQYHVENMGRFNPLFDLNLVYLPTMLNLIFEVFNRDLQTAISWVSQYDNTPENERQLTCNITSLVGDRDISVPLGSWSNNVVQHELHSEARFGRYEQLSFPGDHFFVYHNEALDDHVAKSIVTSILRGLDRYDLLGKL